MHSANQGTKNMSNQQGDNNNDNALDASVKTPPVFSPGKSQLLNAFKKAFAYRRRQRLEREALLAKMFQELPIHDQEKLTKEIREEVITGSINISIKKLPSEAKKDYRLRCFVELLEKIPSKHRKYFKRKLCQKYY